MTRRPAPWRALGALAALWVAVAMNWAWPWGLLFLVATAQAIRVGAIELVDAVSRKEHPSTFWSIAGTWIVLSLALIGWDAWRIFASPG